MNNSEHETVIVRKSEGGTHVEYVEYTGHENFAASWTSRIFVLPKSPEDAVIACYRSGELKTTLVNSREMPLKVESLDRPHWDLVHVLDKDGNVLDRATVKPNTDQRLATFLRTWRTLVQWKCGKSTIVLPEVPSHFSDHLRGAACQEVASSGGQSPTKVEIAPRGKCSEVRGWFERADTRFVMDCRDSELVFRSHAGDELPFLQRTGGPG